MFFETLSSEDTKIRKLFPFFQSFAASEYGFEI